MNWRHWLLLAVAAVVIAVACASDPVAQSPGYHIFSDQRVLFGVPNFWNVVSNFPFFVVGMIGLVSLRGTRPVSYAAYQLFFLGAVLIALGSSAYHLNPENASLLWDRLPMTISFMALVSIVVSEFIDSETGTRLQWPLVIAGLLSVVYWYWTEQSGAGDLRPYAVVQFTPMLLIPLILILFRKPGVAWIWGIVLAYVLAKVLEHYDAAVLAFVGISGHSLKHAVAAGGMLLLVGFLRRAHLGSGLAIMHHGQGA